MGHENLKSCKNMSIKLAQIFFFRNISTIIEAKYCENHEKKDFNVALMLLKILNQKVFSVFFIDINMLLC